MPAVSSMESSADHHSPRTCSSQPTHTRVAISEDETVQRKSTGIRQCAHSHLPTAVAPSSRPKLQPTLPLCPRSTARLAQVWVQYTCTALLLTAAKYWPPLLKQTSLLALMGSSLITRRSSAAQQAQQAQQAQHEHSRHSRQWLLSASHCVQQLPPRTARTTSHRALQQLLVSGCPCIMPLLPPHLTAPS